MRNTPDGVGLAFRRWQRPSVRAGGNLLTPVGRLGIKTVEPVTPDQISAADARRAGYPSRAALLEELLGRSSGEIYRIELGELGPDPRVALRETTLASVAEAQIMQARLQQLDARATHDAWTLRTLELIRAHPEVRAGERCGWLGQDKGRFKLNVRKLKNLGLTESLGMGYRLSHRGQALFTELLNLVGQSDSS